MKGEVIMKKKVAIVTNIPAPYRVALFSYLQENVTEYIFDIVYTSANEDNRSWKIDYEGMKNSYFLESNVIKLRKKYDYKYIHIPSDIKNVLYKINPDIVIAVEYNIAALRSLEWCRKNKKKFIHWTDGTIHSEQNINILQKLARIRIIGKANAYIASSSKAKEKLVAYNAVSERIFISYLTVDITRFSCKISEKKENQLLYVGRFAYLKGLDLLFEALSNLQNDYRLILVGEGPERGQLEAKAYKMGIYNKLTFVGFKEGKELQELYRNSKVFILPTRQDCFGLVILEALCSGVPVVTSKYADGAFDLIKNGVNGYICDPYNPQQLAKCIDLALENSVELSMNTQKELDKFKFENVSKGFCNALEYVSRS